MSHLRGRGAKQLSYGSRQTGGEVKKKGYEEFLEDQKCEVKEKAQSKDYNACFEKFESLIADKPNFRELKDWAERSYLKMVNESQSYDLAIAIMETKMKEIEALADSVKVDEETFPTEKLENSEENILPQDVEKTENILEEVKEVKMKTIYRKIVIRGLAEETTPEEVQKDLENKGIKNCKTTQMISRFGKPLPLFVVSLPREEPAEWKDILNTEVNIEKYRRRRSLQPCRCKPSHKTESPSEGYQNKPKKSYAQAANSNTATEENPMKNLEKALHKLNLVDMKKIIHFILKTVSNRMKEC